MRRTIRVAGAGAGLLLASAAEAAGLSRATSVVNGLTSEVKVLVPLVAVLALIVLGILWGTKVIRFVTLCQFGAAVIVAGSAAEIVNMLFS